MSLLGRYGALGALIVVPLLAVGCGEIVIDDVKTEGAIKDSLSSSFDKRISAVECPSDVEVVAGETFECSLKLSDGEEKVVKLKIRNEDADVELLDLVPRS